MCNDGLPDAYFEPEANASFFSDKDGYINAFDLTIFEPIITDVTESIPENNLIVFPNPTTHELNIVGDEKINNIIIYDMIGNSVISMIDINQNFIQINVELLSSGCYTVVITQKDQQFYSKFIKD